MSFVRPFLVSALALSGCVRGTNENEPPKGAASASMGVPVPSAVARIPAAESAENAAPPDRAREALGDALLEGDYAAAARAWDRLPPDAVGAAERALGAAWLSLENRDFPRAAEAAKAARLDPALRAEADRLYGLAFRGSPETIAPEHFVPSTADFAVARARSARARGLPLEGRGALERAVRDLKREKRRRKSLEVEILAELGRMHLELGEQTLAETVARSLFVEGALLAPELFDPLKVLANSKKRPGRDAILERAERQASAGALGALERTLTEYPVLSNCERRKLEARSVFHARTDYVLAAKNFERASLACPASERPELTFLRGRSLDRAQKTDEARAVFSRLAAQGKGAFHEHAAYALARATLFSGAFEEAEKLYSNYLRLYPKGARHGTEARRERALGTLLGGRASPSIEQLREVPDYGDALHLIGRARSVPPVDVDFLPLAVRAPLSVSGSFARARAKVPVPIPESIRPNETEVPLPSAVRTFHGLGLDELAERILESEEPTLRDAYGSRFSEARCAGYGLIDSGRRRYQVARSELNVRESLPIAADYRWAFECRYPRPYPKLVARAAVESGVPASLLYAVMRQESAFVRGARSPADASGLLQMIPKTAEKVALELGIEGSVDLSNPARSVQFGARYLARLLRQFEGQVPLALAAYNAGPTAVARWAKAFEGAPTEVFLALIPFAETRAYVARVFENYAAYAYLDGGSGALPLPSLSVKAPTGDDELY